MQEHPNKDPLGIAGTVVSSPTIRGGEPIKISVFSTPNVSSDYKGDIITGEAYRYTVKMNYYKVGRKAVTVVVLSDDIERRGKELLITETVKFLAEQADIIDRNAKGDYQIPWDSENEQEAAEDDSD